MSGKIYKLNLELTEEEFNLLQHALWYETLFSYSQRVANSILNKIREQVNEQGKGSDKEEG